MEIQYYNRKKGILEIEKVYGEKGIRWLYESTLGGKFANYLARDFVSRIYGSFQDYSISKRKIKPFISKFDIDMDDYLPEEGRSESDPYSNFNQFFIRRFKKGKRVFPSAAEEFGAPAEARYYAYESLSDNDVIPVKGNLLSPRSIIKDERWFPEFAQGPVLLARLCPVDYHRYHFPDNGSFLDSYPIEGKYHSVNPSALKWRPEIFAENERHISIVKTENFGKLAYVEVGAMMVGKIVQTSKKNYFLKGEEKGYFLFGGSTVIIFGQKGLWKPDEDILNNTQNGVETYLHLGEPCGLAI